MDGWMDMKRNPGNLNSRIKYNRISAECRLAIRRYECWLESKKTSDYDSFHSSTRRDSWADLNLHILRQSGKSGGRTPSAISDEIRVIEHFLSRNLEELAEFVRNALHFNAHAIVTPRCYVYSGWCFAGHTADTTTVSGWILGRRKLHWSWSLAISLFMWITYDQHRWTISSVAADWHKLMVPQHTMWPSITGDNGQWCSWQTLVQTLLHSQQRCTPSSQTSLQIYSICLLPRVEGWVDSSVILKNDPNANG